METYINALISRIQAKIYKVIKGKAIIITRVCLVQLFYMLRYQKLVEPHQMRQQ
jgi:hypothetical protein